MSLLKVTLPRDWPTQDDQIKCYHLLVFLKDTFKGSTLHGLSADEVTLALQRFLNGSHKVFMRMFLRGLVLGVAFGACAAALIFRLVTEWAK